MGKQVKLDNLITGVKDELSKLNLSRHTVQTYEYLGFKVLRKIHDKQGAEFYDSSLIKQTLFQYRQLYEENKIRYEQFKILRKVASWLEEYYHTNSIQWRCLTNWQIDRLNDFFKAIIDMYKSKENALDIRSSRTITCNIGFMKNFLLFLQNKGLQDLSKLTLPMINSYLTIYSRKYASIKKVTLALKYLNESVQENNIDCIDFSVALTARPAPRRKLMPVLTSDEISKIFNQIDISTSIGKRDYAAFLLAKNTGIRAIDVSKLKLADINWYTNKISLIQSKTKRKLILPLEPDVGNAIIDYILNGRPESESQYLFLRTRIPYTTISHGLRDRLAHYMRKANVYDSGKGFHGFRRNIATQLLNYETNADTIKEILGHSKIDSLRPYMRININQLSKCALGLAHIPVLREELQ